MDGWGTGYHQVRFKILGVGAIVKPIVRSVTNAFHRESTQVVGQYTPGGRTIVFNPLQTGDRSPIRTLVHENMHQYLTRNSYYGAFLQALSLFAQRGMFREQFAIARINSPLRRLAPQCTCTIAEDKQRGCRLPDASHKHRFNYVANPKAA